MKRDRFSDEWIQKVESWAHDHAVMIERYNAFRCYQKMKDIVYELEFNSSEMHRFYSCEGPIRQMNSDKEEWPGDDIDSDDWEEPVSHQTRTESG
jgi:hypothetical protein